MPARSAILVVEDGELYLDFLGCFSPSRYTILFAETLDEAGGQLGHELELVAVPAARVAHYEQLLRQVAAQGARTLACGQPAGETPALEIIDWVVDCDTDEAVVAAAELLSERRQQQRASMRVPVDLGEHGGRVFASSASAEALFVPSADPLEAGSTLELALGPEGSEVTCEARVVRVGDGEEGERGMVLAVAQPDSPRGTAAREQLEGLVRRAMLSEHLQRWKEQSIPKHLVQEAARRAEALMVRYPTSEVATDSGQGSYLETLRARERTLWNGGSAPQAAERQAIPEPPMADPDPAEPAEAEVEPAEVEVEPAEAEVEPAEVEVEPAATEVEPAEAEVEPAEVELEPAEVEVEPAEVEVEPAEVEVGPAEVEVEPAEVEPVESDDEAALIPVSQEVTIQRPPKHAGLEGGPPEEERRGEERADAEPGAAPTARTTDGSPPPQAGPPPDPWRDEVFRTLENLRKQVSMLAAARPAAQLAQQQHEAQLRALTNRIAALEKRPGRAPAWLALAAVAGLLLAGASVALWLWLPRGDLVLRRAATARPAAGPATSPALASDAAAPPRAADSATALASSRTDAAGDGAMHGDGGKAMPVLSRRARRALRLRRARRLIDQGKHAEARIQLNKALALGDGARLRLVFAGSHRAAGERWPALHHLNKALALGPKDRPAVQRQVGELLLELKKRDKACAAFRAAGAEQLLARHCKD